MVVVTRHLLCDVGIRTFLQQYNLQTETTRAQTRFSVINTFYAQWPVLPEVQEGIIQHLFLYSGHTGAVPPWNLQEDIEKTLLQVWNHTNENKAGLLNFKSML